MKKLFLLILILLLGWGAWEVWHNRAGSAPEVKIEPAVTRPDPSNATIKFEDGPITLKNGSATTSVTPDGGITQDTDLTDAIAYGDLNNDNKNDSAFVLVQTGSGSGVFVYIAAYVSGVVQYKGSNALFVGDRITPKTISIDSKGVITLTYLDRKPTEPFTAEPTVLTTKHYAFSVGELVEK